MDLQTLLNYPLAQAWGAPRHHHYFTTDHKTAQSILAMADIARQQGLAQMLLWEYPNPRTKNIIVNLIDGQGFLTDGNRHCVAALLADPNLTFGDLEAARPGVLRIWQAGVEAGRNTAADPYEVYIPADVDISRIPEARMGTDYFKSPPAPTAIVPGTFRSDSPLLREEDRGRPLGETVQAVKTFLQPKPQEDLPEYGRMTSRLPFQTPAGALYFDPLKSDLVDSSPVIRGVVEIPKTFRNQTVTEIGMDVFNRRKGLTQILFPDTIRTIWNAAFYGCDGLSSVTLPASLTTLGPDAFGQCRNLRRVVFTGIPQSIGGGAFYGCDKLETVHFPGTRDQWAAIRMEPGNDSLLQADIHFEP